MTELASPDRRKVKASARGRLEAVALNQRYKALTGISPAGGVDVGEHLARRVKSLHVDLLRFDDHAIVALEDGEERNDIEAVNDPGAD